MLGGGGGQGTQRRYVRIPSIIPVQYQLLSSGTEPLDHEIRTGFTRDLSAGGLCLRAYGLSEEIIESLGAPPESLGITVDLALPARILRLRGRVVWATLETGKRRPAQLLGVELLNLAPPDATEIVSFARRAARRPKIIRGAIVTLAALLCVALGLYGWSRAQHERSQRQLDRARDEAAQSADRYGDIQVELRWLTVQVGEILEMLDAQAARSDRDTNDVRPALEELTENVERLSEVVAELEARGPSREALP